MRGEWGLLEVRYEGGRRWVGSDPAPAPTDSPTEAADMQAAAAAVLFLLAGETINPETIYCLAPSNLFPAAYISPAVGLIWSAARFPVDIWVIAARADFSADFSERFVRQSHPAVT